MVVAINVRRQWGDLLADEVSYRISQQIGGVTQAKI
jgi:hypothetical protein